MEQRALALALLAVGATGNYPVLAEAISSFVYRRVSYDASEVRPFIPALLSFLDYDIGTTGANSYYTLITLTCSRPDYFQPYASILIDMLDSPRNSTVAFASKIIAALAREHQEYVVGGEKALRCLSHNHPQQIVRKAASDALDAIRDNLMPAAMNLQAEHRPGTGEEMFVNPGDSGRRSSMNTGLDHPSESNTASDITSFPAYVAIIMDELLNLKLHVSLSIIRHASDDDEINAVIGDFLEIAPLIINEFRAQMETTEAMVRTPSVDETIAVATPNAFTAMLAEDAFSEDPFINALPIEAATSKAKNAESTCDIQALDDAQIAELQLMMEAVKQDFSSTAANILITFGLEHLKPGDISTTDDLGRQINAMEFITALKTLMNEHNNGQLKVLETN